MINKYLLLTIAILIIAMSSKAQVKKTITDKKVDKIGQVDRINGSVTFTDARDGKIYKTVKIGTQTWMAENLAFKPNTGCRAYDDNETNVAKYGYLYNWETAKRACPSGWHLPSGAEWTMLITYLGGDTVAGGKLKESGTTHWISPNTGATNLAGFRALPGGEYAQNGTYVNIGVYGKWWSTTETNLQQASGARFWLLNNYNKSAYFVLGNRDLGLSVRCVCNPNQIF